MKDFVSSLTWVDWLALGALLWGLFIGSRSGIFKELLRFVVYVLALLGSYFLYQPIGEYLTLHTFLNDNSAKALAFAASVIALFILGKLLTMLILKMLKTSEKGAANRIGGALLGASRMLVLLSFVFLIVDHSPLSQLKKDLHSRSLTGPYLTPVAPTIVEFVTQFSAGHVSPLTKEA